MSLRLITGDVAELRARPEYQPDCAALARNRITLARSRARLSPAEFAALLAPLVGREVTAGHVVSWEGKATPPGDVLIAADTVSPTSRARLGVRSHKFIVGHVGQAAADAIRARSSGTTGKVGGFECCSIPVEHPSGRCDLHIWPFGSVIFHLVEDLDVSGIATLALWRVQSYDENLAWAAKELHDLTGEPNAKASYVFSAYWVHTPIWSGKPLTTALRLICCPRVLLDREIGDPDACQHGAEEAERALLTEGYEHAGMRLFGVRGVSAGYASWSGVSYYPIDPDRALAEDELVSFELALQSVWSYCEHVNGRIEQGLDLDDTGAYGYRFLRAAKSRLTTPRPQEKGQHQSMREAIVETSGLPGILAQALDVMREDARR